MRTVYASFADAGVARQAVGALLDRGIEEAHLSLITREQDSGWPVDRKDEVDPDAAEQSAKKGITTTTTGDATSGAVKGAGIGLGVGTLAALASLAIPGVGLVIGGGALATAIAGALGATAAGAVSGGAFGYLKDQGVDPEVARRFAADLDANGAAVTVDLLSEDMAEAEVEDVLRKYGARNVHLQGAVLAPAL